MEPDVTQLVAEHRTAPFSMQRALRQEDDEDKDKDVYRIVIAAEDMGVDLSRMDVESRYASNPVVLLQHNSMAPIGRTVRGPYREDGRWVAEFVFATGDDVAERIRNLYTQQIVNAASIGFNLVSDADGNEYPVLIEWSLVAVGMDKSALALRQLDTTIQMLEEQQMTTPEEREEAVAEEAVIDEPSEAEPVEEEVAEEEVIAEDEDEPVEDASAEADAEDAASDGEADGRAVEDVVTRADADAMIALALEREKLAVRAAELLPAGMNTETATTREMLVAAVQSEVSDIDARSDDYLRGRLDAILERRARSVASTGSSAGIVESKHRPRSIREVINMNQKES